MGTPVRFTTADLETLPDALDDTRYEVIDGELYVAHQPHWDHQFTCFQIAAVLQAWSRQTGAGVANVAPGVIFSPEDDVAPDVIWMSRERRASIVDADGKLYGAPELMVEVLSPGPTNERRDREAKLKLYSLHGVREYWIVDWRAKTIQIYRRHEAQLRLAATLTNEDRVTSPLLPGFACPVADLWEPEV